MKTRTSGQQEIVWRRSDNLVNKQATDQSMFRREFLKFQALWPVSFLVSANRHDVKVIITGIKVHVVKVNLRGNWHFVELVSNKGITGIGEASHGFAIKDGDGQLMKEISILFESVKGETPFSVGQFRQRSWATAYKKGKTAITAFSAIEQALWDLAGKILDTPVYNLLGGKLHDRLKVYANINRATNQRDTQGRRLIDSFQRNAEEALKAGFKAVKLAPFDDMKPLENAVQTEADIDYAVRCVEAVRATIGPETDLLIDVHSHLNKELAVSTAKRLEKSNLFWFEEAIDPQKYPEETRHITDSIKQSSAGGESIAGREGFEKIITSRALDIIMPDVKHCGGIQELRFIAAQAETSGNITIAPHNPSGPVATAASVQVCATLPNFSILEYAFGEAPWRADLLSPAEHFENGYVSVSDKPGLGHTFNYELLSRQKL